MAAASSIISISSASLFTPTTTQCLLKHNYKDHDHVHVPSSSSSYFTTHAALKISRPTTTNNDNILSLFVVGFGFHEHGVGFVAIVCMLISALLFVIECSGLFGSTKNGWRCWWFYCEVLFILYCLFGLLLHFLFGVGHYLILDFWRWWCVEKDHWFYSKLNDFF